MKSRLPIIAIGAAFFIVIHILFDSGDNALFVIREWGNFIMLLGCGLVVIRLVRGGVHKINDLSFDMVLFILAVAISQGWLFVNTNLSQRGVALEYEHWMPTDDVLLILFAPLFYRLLIVPLLTGSEPPVEDTDEPAIES